MLSARGKYSSREPKFWVEIADTQVDFYKMGIYSGYSTNFIGCSRLIYIAPSDSQSSGDPSKLMRAADICSNQTGKIFLFQRTLDRPVWGKVMDERIVSVLRPAYGPCPGFLSSCPDMRWRPSEGHVPRGFLGATAELNDVELILVFAEPGDPQADEVHTGMESAIHYAFHYHQRQKDLFHRNVRHVLDLCWPRIPFEAQLKRVWMTESVLCSAQRECGPVSSSTERACGERYLLRQLSLFPNALIVALGTKAKKRLRALGLRDFLAVGAVAPPGCNQAKVRDSWRRIPEELARHRDSNTGLGHRAVPQNGQTAECQIPTTSAQPIIASKARRNALIGTYRVIDKSRLRATSDSDPGKWSIWQCIWESQSFEELAKKCPAPVYTSTNRRITWQSEAKHAIKSGWILPLSDPDDISRFSNLSG